MIREIIKALARMESKHNKYEEAILEQSEVMGEFFKAVKSNLARIKKLEQEVAKLKQAKK
ncbi:hypothetical protein KVL58_07640 [Helicobacter pylori]|nr:hypothetical protein KVL58_07640 [Helicobacter pylori]